MIGAVIDLGLCLDLTSSYGLESIKIAYESLVAVTKEVGLPLPVNSGDGLRRNLDCAVITRLHSIRDGQNFPAVDTVKGVFTEGSAIYPGSGFLKKTHIQIAVRNPQCIKGVFRVQAKDYES